MKKELIMVVLVVSVLVISISLVSAESNETGATNETEVIDETEPETCAASISINFNQDGFYEGGLFEITTEIFDSQGNPLPNYGFYTTTYDNMWHTPFLRETGAEGYLISSGIAGKPTEGVKTIKFKVYTQETDSCGVVEDIKEIGYVSREEKEVEETGSEQVPTTCAAKIEVNFDKAVYAIGDLIEAEVGIFDSQGNPLSNYGFYGKRYDDRWHSPDFQRTGGDGYFRFSGKAEKGPLGVTKGIFNVYTEEIGSCGSVEDTTEISLEQPEPVPCGIGTCIPEEEVGEEPIEIPEDEMFYKCNGCELEDKCYPMGYRKKGEFCSEDYEFVSQIKEETCENNFECKSNICITGECVEEGLMKRIIKWFKKLFGVKSKAKDRGLELCSELLIEEDIGDYEYVESSYGHRDHQVAVYSEEGEQIDIVKCCAAGYSEDEGAGGTAGVVCPFDNKKDVENSLKRLLDKEEITLGEYKGQEVYTAGNAIVWTHKKFIVASGTDPKATTPLPEEIINAYFDEYPNDLV